MIEEIKNHDRDDVKLNLYGLDYEATEEDIRDYYQEVNIIRVFKGKKDGIFDVIFATKEDAIKAVENTNERLKKRHF